MAKKNDIVVLCGRGHETMQEINGVKSHFDEREVLQEVFAELKADSTSKQDDNTNNEEQVQEGLYKLNELKLSNENFITVIFYQFFPIFNYCSTIEKAKN